MKTQLICALTAVLLFIMPNVNFGQAPVLGRTSTFALFTASGATNSGASIVTGDIGTYVGEITGFSEGTVNGHIYFEGDPVSAQAAADVALAYADLSVRTCTPGLGLGTPFGNGQILLPGVHCIGSAAALQGELILDATGDPDGIFIIKIGGALEVAANSNIKLINTSWCNVYWQINGAFELGAGAHFEGTVIASGAISLLAESSLLGRGLTTAGAINLNTNVVNLPLPGAAGTITGTAIVCSGQQGVIFSVPEINNAPGYIWTLPAGATIVAGINTNRITVDFNEAAVSGDITVSGTDACSSGAVSANFPITVNQLLATPTVSVIQPTCEIAGSARITNYSSEYSYTFSPSGPTVGAGGVITGFTIGQDYTVTSTNDNCTSAASVPFTIEDALGGPDANAGSDKELTSTITEVTLDGSSSTAGVSYKWSTPDGNIVSGGNTATPTVDAIGSYTLTVTAPNGCTDTDVAIVTQDGVVTAASLTIVKVADKSAFYKAGEVINYTITVANTGKVSLTGVQIEDKLSRGKIITELTVHPDGGDLDGDYVLDVGETWIYKTNYTVTQSDIDFFISTKSASLLKCAQIVELINVATVVTNQTKPQSDDATSILETSVLGNTKVYGSVTKVANRRAVPVTFKEAGTINSISIYHNGGTGNVLLGVYSNQTSSPLTRLGVTESTVINPKAGWQTVTLSSPVKVISGQTVWLSWVFQNNPGVRYIIGTPGRKESTGTWYSGMPETFGTAKYAANKYSIYCSYTTDAVATLAVSPASISLDYSSGASGTFDITSNTNWSITDNAGWLDVSSVSGINNGTITVTANSANTGTNPRTATVSIAGAGVTTKTVTVIQDNQTTALGNTKVFSSVTKVANRRAVPVTFSEAGTINSISIYHNGGTGNVLLGVYSNQSGSPLTRLGVTESTAINPIAGWQTVSLLSPVNVISGQTVWLSWVFQNNPGVRYTTGTPGRKESTGTWSSGMPETFGAANNAAYKYSIYCSYIADESKSAEIANEIKPAFESADLKVYPNPFSDKLRFEFVSPESVNARIDLYDMTGRMVKTIFEQPIEADVNYEAEFEPDAIISGMYIYRMKMGDAIYNGKVIFKKE